MGCSPTPRADAFAITVWSIIEPEAADAWLDAHVHLSMRELADEARRRHGDEIASRAARLREVVKIAVTGGGLFDMPQWKW